MRKKSSHYKKNGTRMPHVKHVHHRRAIKRSQRRSRKAHSHSIMPFVVLIIIFCMAIAGIYIAVDANFQTKSAPDIEKSNENTADNLIESNYTCDGTSYNVSNDISKNITTNIENNPAETLPTFNYYNITPRIDELNAYLESNIYYKTTFLTPFPIMTSPMPYYIYTNMQITDNITEAQSEHILYSGWYKIAKEQIPKAFSEWEKASGGKIKFVQSDVPVKDGITVKIVSEIPRKLYGDVYDIGSILGVSNPDYNVLKNYTLIVGGEISIRADYSPYQTRMVMIHEIGHLLGFGHAFSQNDIMYAFYDKYENYGRITEYNKKVLEILYSDVP